MSRKPTNTGIAGVEPRQLALTVGTMGSGSTDSPAPSPTIANLTASTRFDGSSSAMAIDSASPFSLDTNVKIDIDTTIDTAIGIAVPTIIDTVPSETEVDIAKAAVIDIASLGIADLTPAATIVDTTSTRQEQFRR
jgi:hypothetical protein